MKKQLLFILMTMIPLMTSAHDFAVQNADGVTIYYNYINDGTELAVTYCGTLLHSDNSSDYTGIVVIPEEVTYMNKTRKVTSIGKYAFYGCRGLSSVTIGNSISSIGMYSFYKCCSLTSIDIPNSVMSIEGNAFEGCTRLTSFYVDEANNYFKSMDDILMSKDGTVLVAYPPGRIESTYIIPNSVTSIGVSAFLGCERLTSVTIGNSVTSIGNSAFMGCYGLTSVVIPDSVTSISNASFAGCTGLTSITIGNSVTKIETNAFFGCFCLTSVTIPNSVVFIYDSAFSQCLGLTSVTIGNNVAYIGSEAFAGCNIPEVISKIENPYGIPGNSFTRNTFNNATLYVPVGTIDEYRNKDGWKNFVFIEEGVPSDIEQSLSKIRQIQSEDGVLTIQNIKNGTYISVYNANGTFVGSTISKNEQAKIDTNMQPGSIAIVKIGEQSVKMIIK